MKKSTFTPLLLSVNSEQLLSFRHHLSCVLEHGKLLTEVHAELFLKREMPLEEVVELLKASDVRQELEIKYLEAHQVKVEGLPLKMDALRAMVEIVDHTAPVEWVAQIRKHWKALQEIRPKAISLKELHDGKKFYAPTELPEELKQKITALFENYTQSEKQNQAYQAAGEIKDAFRETGRTRRRNAYVPPITLALKQLFDSHSPHQQGALIHQFPLNPGCLPKVILVI